MILVSTGTNGDSFDRLLSAVLAVGLDEELVIQHGPSTVRVPGASHIEYLSFADYQSLVSNARVVVTHAGVGSVLVALLAGKRPVLVPRLARFAEAVDDHQLDFARRLASLGSVILVEDTDQLREAIEDAARSRPWQTVHGAQSELIRDLGSHLSAVVGARSSTGFEEIGSAAPHGAKRAS